MSATSNLAGAVPLADGPISANHTQIPAFSQRSRDEWCLEMERTRGEARGSERTSRAEKYRYIDYLVFPKDPLLPKAETKKRAWVRENCYMSGGSRGILMRKPTVNFKEARVVRYEEELCELIIKKHCSLGHTGQDVTATAVI